ncbi:TetR/AcrR family transcriptional regulator [Flavobacterium sp.]
MIDFTDKQIEILQAAESLFSEVGFDGTTVRAISKKANINVAMISYYFGSKEKLLESLVVYRTSAMQLDLENLLLENISPIIKIEKLITFYIHTINSNRCMYQILHFEMSNKKRDLDLKAFTDVKKNNLELLTKIIHEGQQQQLFKKDIAIELIPPTIIGSFTHFYMNKDYYQDLLGLHTKELLENYISTTFTEHIQKTIKSLLVYENN